MYWHGMSGFGFPFPLFFWVLVSLGIFYLVRTAARSTAASRSGAIEVLKRMHASGEISGEAYREIVKTLEKENG